MLAAYKAAYKACRLRRLCFFDVVILRLLVLVLL